jgi:putative ABC transport system permease protein
MPVLEQDITLIGRTGHEAVELIATDPRYLQPAGGLLGLLTSTTFEKRVLGLATRSLRSFPSTQRRYIAHQLIFQRVLAVPAPIANSIGSHPFDTLSVQTGGLSVPTVVATTLRSSEIGPLAHSPVVVTSLAYAQALTQTTGKLTRLLVQAQPGKRLQVLAGLKALANGRLNVEPADFDAEPVNQSTETFAAICALVGFMFAYCSMLLATNLRKELVTQLRLAGATRAETLKALIFDAVVLGTIASLLGLALGDLLSVLVFRSNPGFLSFAFPIGSQRIVTWHSIALAFAAGLLAGVIGVLAPLRNTGARPQEMGEATESTSSRLLTASMLIGGLGALTATAIILFTAPQAAVAGIVTLLVALLVLLPLLISATIAVFDRLQQQFGSSATALAALELRSPATRIRSLAIASTAAIAVFGSVTIQGSHENVQAGLERSAQGVTSVADLWITPLDTRSLFGTVPFKSPPALTHLTSIPGVQAAGIYRASFLDLGDRRVWVLAPSPTTTYPLPPSQLVTGDLSAATAKLHDGGWAAVSQTLAKQQHLHIGERFVLQSPIPLSLRIAALSTNLGWPPGAILLNSNDYIRAWGDPRPTAYNIKLTPAASPSYVRYRIQQLLIAEGVTGLAVQTAHEREIAQDAAVHQGLGRLTQIALLAIIAGILATATSMTAVITQRRPQYARLKIQGLARNVLWLALIWESIVLIGAGCLIGALFGIAGQILLSHALLTVTGFPVVFSARAIIATKILVAVTATAAGMIAISGYQAASTRPLPRP